MKHFVVFEKKIEKLSVASTNTLLETFHQTKNDKTLFFEKKKQEEHVSRREMKQQEMILLI